MLIGAGTLAYLLPMIAIAAIGSCSRRVTRNSAAAVVGTLMVSLFIQILGAIYRARRPGPYLLSRSSTPGRASCGPDRLGADRARRMGLGLYALPALGAALRFLRRDVAGG